MDFISFRHHAEFHEQCVERIFQDVLQRCAPQCLAVEARYTRRGGLDINPLRTTSEMAWPLSVSFVIRVNSCVVAVNVVLCSGLEEVNVRQCHFASKME